ncbi:MAG: hypothetical protein HC910_09275 [Spirulinaceae cyanobacterium SM2_1_0]|nr:hypothetical protein [Spirulinaceae cyanobacterium SM2_1_0]
MARSTAAKKKTFSSFTYAEAFKHLNLTELNAWDFAATPRQPSDFFQERLRRLRISFDLQSQEEAKKLLIDAICEEAIVDCQTLKIWKGAPLADELTSGYVDYVVAERKGYLEAPFVCIIEAKKDDFQQGLAQCLVEMKACQANNQAIGRNIDIFGIVTNGQGWQFYCLHTDGNVDATDLYSTGNMADLLGRLHALFQRSARQIALRAEN